MNECLLEIRYLVDNLGDIEIENDLIHPARERGFEYLLIIQLNSKNYNADEMSTLSILHNGKEVFSRLLKISEISSLLEAVSNIKFSFGSANMKFAQHPQMEYSIILKRSTAVMSFAWSDGNYITEDTELLYALMKLVNLITFIEPIDYGSLGFESPAYV
jgi:hypothetical protein